MAEQPDHTAQVRHLLSRVHKLLCALKYQEALPLAQRAVALAPTHREAWCELGATCGYLRRVAELEEAFERALPLALTREDELDTWFCRGIAENNADAWGAAVRSFTRLAELAPELGFPWLMRGMVLGNMGAFLDRRYHEEALVALDRALARRGLSPHDKRVAYSLQYFSLVGLGRKDEAAEAKGGRRKAKEMRRAERQAKKLDRQRPLR